MRPEPRPRRRRPRTAGRTGGDEHEFAHEPTGDPAHRPYRCAGARRRRRSALSLAFDGALEEGRFLERPNRFLVRAELLREPGAVVEAHLPDPGRLKELLAAGRRLWLAPARSSTRRTRWTAALAETPSGDGLVSIDATLPNRLVARALEEGLLEEVGPYEEVRSEPRHGSHRFDFLLKRRVTGAPAGAAGSDGPNAPRWSGPGADDLLLEVKSVTLVEARVGLFPDAVTARGARHLRELAALARDGQATAVLFVLQRRDADRVRAARTIDPDFADALEEAAAAGVHVKARRCRVTLQGVALAEPVPVDVGPAPSAEPDERPVDGTVLSADET